jgi:hypothetical protein
VVGIVRCALLNPVPPRDRCVPHEGLFEAELAQIIQRHNETKKCLLTSGTGRPLQAHPMTPKDFDVLDEIP